MKILYLDFFLGMEVEMFLGALLSLGEDKDALEKELKAVFPSACIILSDVKRAGLESLRADVVFESDRCFGCDEAMEYVNSNICDGALAKHLKKIIEIYFSYDKNAVIKEIEICKIYALCLAFKAIGADYVISSEVSEGSGFCEKDGGYFMIPSASAVEIFEKYHIRIRLAEIEKELTGTLGASVLASLVNEYGAMPEMDIEKIGYGAGKEDFELANIMRAVVGSSNENQLGKMFESEDLFMEISEEIFV